MPQIYLDWAVAVGRNRDFRNKALLFPGISTSRKEVSIMDRLRQISAEIIRLYRKQLNVWVLEKIANLKDADLLQYDRRQDRIAELRKELESMARVA